MDLQELGFTKEELQERVIDKIVQRVMNSTEYNYDSDSEYLGDSQFARDLQKRVKEQIDASINDLAAKHVLPNVAKYIEELTLQTTNQWGERVGTPVTFIEYLTQRAEAYMTEKVSFDGKAKTEANGYSWNGTQTRITYLVHQHLHYSIETAMKQALQIANSAIASGIQETVKQKLGEISSSLKVSVATK